MAGLRCGFGLERRGPSKGPRLYAAICLVKAATARSPGRGLEGFDPFLVLPFEEGFPFFNNLEEMGLLPAFRPGAARPINRTAFGCDHNANLWFYNAAPPLLGRGSQFKGNALKACETPFLVPNCNTSLPDLARRG